jgi:SAM-dependent methyltransferase
MCPIADALSDPVVLSALIARAHTGTVSLHRAGHARTQERLMASQDNSISIYPGLEFWLSSTDMAAKLRDIDARIATTAPADIPALWDGIPFDVFSLLAFHRPPQYRNLLAFFPDWPSTKVQEETVGASGLKLQLMTSAFIRSMTNGARQHLRKPLNEARVLDYGVGFGRNIRMLSKFVPSTQLYGVDPFVPHVETCQKLGVKAQILTCDPLPTSLPGPLANSRLDMVFLFSIFTHLSEKAHLKVLKVIHDHLDDDGLLVVTVRPEESWNVVVPPKEVAAYREQHRSKGIAFMPIGVFVSADGEPTFGETSISLDFVRRQWTGWDIVGMDLNLIDPYQLILFLKKKR